MELLEFKKQAQRTQRREDPPHELRDLWVWLVTRWQSIARALSACELIALQHFGESELRKLWQFARGLSTHSSSPDFRHFLEALAPSFSPRSQQLPRGRLLEALADCAPRITFRHWSNTLLLAYEKLSDLAITFSSAGTRHAGDQASHAKSANGIPRLLDGNGSVSEEDFIEVLAMQEVCAEDALSWLEALRSTALSSAQNTKVVDLKLLMKRIIDQRIGVGGEAFFGPDDFDRPSDCMPLADIAVRLVHSFGDLTQAFNLLPKASQVNQAVKSAKSKVRSLSPQYSKALPGAHQPRQADIGAQARQEIKGEPKEQKEQDVYSLSEKQWFHALRGSSEKRLLSDAEAKAEATRQVAWQTQRDAVAAALDSRIRPSSSLLGQMHSTLQSLFPNLSERLCIAKTAFQPFEAMLVRASLTPCGFFGHRFVRAQSASARHFASGDVTALCGSKPFVAVVPLGSEKALANCEEVEMEYQACLEAATAGTAVAMLRAPGLVLFPIKSKVHFRPHWNHLHHGT